MQHGCREHCSRPVIQWPPVCSSRCSTFGGTGLMTFRRVSGACGFVLLFSGLVAGTRAPHTIHLKSGVLELDDRLVASRRSVLETAEEDLSTDGSQLQQYLVAVDPADRALDADALHHLLLPYGGFVCSYVPDHTYRIAASATAASKLQTHAGVKWLGDFTAPMKLAPAWDRVLSWAATCRERARASHDFTCEVSGAEAPYVWDHDGPAVKLMAQFARPMVAAPGSFLRLPSQENATAEEGPAAAAWRELQALHPDVACQDQGRHWVSIWVPVSELQDVLDWLADQALVHWLEPMAKLHRHNWLASGICQSDTAANLDSNGYGQNSTTSHPVWAAGLQGTGIVVGMGDTGIDVKHCHFADSNVAFSGFLKEAGTGVSYFDSTTHRKIRYYRMFLDALDANGHGTHCAGSVMGYPQSGLQSDYSDWGGAAPQAKIAFQDLGNDTSGSISVPSDIADGYLAYNYARGAKVHSDSWGASVNGAYDSLSEGFDTFCYQHQDFLPFVAAGNFGTTGLDSSVSSPSTAKNVMAVGAGLTAPYSLEVEQETVTTDASVLAMNIMGGLPGSSVDGTIVYKAMQGAFGPALGTLGSSSMQLVAAAPSQLGCSAYPQGTSFKGQAVLVQRGTCTFAVKVALAMKLGAKAVIIANNGSTGFFRMTQTGYDGTISIPSASMPQNSARYLWNALAAGSTLYVSFSPYELPAARWESIASFSSIGPTTDGRIKPDIIAPGTTLSAKSAGTTGNSLCVLALERGTSMATPIAAGNAALVQQYFQEGWYPTGVKTPANSMQPSGALMKAVLLGGADAMQGIAPSYQAQYDGVPLDPPPSPRQGFGRLNLGNTLLFPGATSRLRVVNSAVMAATGQVDSYCVQATGNGPLKVTLVWTDPPADPSVARALVNDLDLTVNADSLNGYSLHGNGAKDYVNNVEQVTMASLSSGIVIITVIAYNLPIKPQPYALAVQGAFTGDLSLSTSNQCILPVAYISAGPPTLSNASSATFVFNATQVAPAGFECSLRVSGTSSASWATCSSPKTYTSLSSAIYYFSVRAKGFTLQDSKVFTLDQSPPVTSITAATIPFQDSKRAAQFSFGATDMLPVYSQCKLTGPNIGNVVGVDSLGTWEVCTSPQTFQSLGAGSWSFSVRSIDGAGNVETITAPFHSWTIALSSGYPIISGGDSGITAKSSATFQFGPASTSTGSQAFVQGPAAGNPTSQASTQGTATFVCSLDVNDGVSFVVYGSYSDALCTSPMTYNNLQAGTYQFSVYPSGGDSSEAAMSQVTVGTDGPACVITQQPASVIPAPSFSFAFVSDPADPTVSYACQLTGSALSAQSFVACTSPKSYSNIVDGNYKFQVMAVAASGDVGAAQEADFTVDTTGPTVDNVTFSALMGSAVSQADAEGSQGTYAVSASKPAFSVAFTNSDGILGSGVNRSACALVPYSASALAAMKAGTTSSSLFDPCSSLSIRYTADTTTAGSYLFVVRAYDNAQNTGQSPTYSVQVSGALQAACSAGLLLLSLLIALALLL